MLGATDELIVLLLVREWGGAVKSYEREPRGREVLDRASQKEDGLPGCRRRFQLWLSGGRTMCGTW